MKRLVETTPNLT